MISSLGEIRVVIGILHLLLDLQFYIARVTDQLAGFYFMLCEPLKGALSSSYFITPLARAIKAI
jgi:hypothetical protein